MRHLKYGKALLQKGKDKRVFKAIARGTFGNQMLRIIFDHYNTQEYITP